MSNELSQRDLPFLRLAKTLKIPLTVKEFCPPAAQLVRDVCARLREATPPDFHPWVVSAASDLRVFSVSVTCPKAVMQNIDNKKTDAISLLFMAISIKLKSITKNHNIHIEHCLIGNAGELQASLSFQR
jgi:hypothetical protein